MATVADLRIANGIAIDAATRDLTDLVGAFSNPYTMRDELLATYPDLVAGYGNELSSWAADFYDDRRLAAGARGSYRATVAPPVPEEQVIGSARWAIGPAFDDDWDLALQQLIGATTRLIQEPGRETIQWNSDRDPEARGWQREVRAGACQFCQMLAGRGGVYTRRSAFFAAHDNCRCVIAPSWDSKAPAVPAPLYQISRRTSTMSASAREAHRARIRQYLEDHADELS